MRGANRGGRPFVGGVATERKVPRPSQSRGSATCPVCQRPASLTTEGKIRGHRVERFAPVCTGSGATPPASEK